MGHENGDGSSQYGFTTRYGDGVGYASMGGDGRGDAPLEASYGDGDGDGLGDSNPCLRLSGDGAWE